MLPEVYIGIDPGAKGAIAYIEGFKTFTYPLSGATEKDVLDFLRSIPGGDARVAAIEEIGTAIFGTSKSSNSKLYGSYKSLRMAALAADLKFEAVPAKVWQAAMRIKKRPKESDTSWKNRLKTKAQDLFPRKHITLATADALLIAEYLRRQYRG